MAKIYKGKNITKKQWSIIKYVLTMEYRGKTAHKQYALTETPRTHYDPDSPCGMDGIEYGFLGKNLTDEEIAEMVDDMRMVVCSPWDCSGQYFTKWIEIHKNPSGLVSFVHHFGIDI